MKPDYDGSETNQFIGRGERIQWPNNNARVAP